MASEGDSAAQPEAQSTAELVRWSPSATLCACSRSMILFRNVSVSSPTGAP